MQRFGHNNENYTILEETPEKNPRLLYEEYSRQATTTMILLPNILKILPESGKTILPHELLVQEGWAQYYSNMYST